MNSEFDRKWGEDFLASIPAQSGVYIFQDADGTALYVGKARNLRKRLGQYRVAGRKRSQRKMRLIVKQATKLAIQICEDEQEALLLENRLIQQHRPPLNVSGAFFFMYPFLALRRDPMQPHTLVLAFSTSPEALADLGFQLYGAFRSRQVIIEAYEALAYLLPYIGHHTPADRKRFGRVSYSRLISFRQIDPIWMERLQGLFEGRHMDFIQELVLYLLEKPRARVMAAEVQQHLKALQALFQDEAKRLRQLMDALGFQQAFVPQSDRDRLFLEWQKLRQDCS